MTQSLTGVLIVKRARELKPVRDRVAKIWGANPTLTPREVQDILTSEGVPSASVNTIYGWLKRLRRRMEHPQPVASLTPMTWQQVVKAVPDVETLANLVFQGLMSELDRRDQKYNGIKQENKRLQGELSRAVMERDKIAAEFNERLAKAKIGTLDIDQVQHKLFRKR